jgi:phage terminase large subunit-like protein
MPKFGPKSGWEHIPPDLSGLPDSGGERVIVFTEQFLRVPKGKGAKELFKVRPWQGELIHPLFDEPRPRKALISIPVGNGKSTLAACLGMYGLLADDVQGAEIIIVASDQRQAGIIYRTCKRMVELEPKLDYVQIYFDRLYVPSTGSSLAALPSEPAALEGWDPSLAIIDELQVVPRETFEAIVERAGKRDRSLTLAISTPPRNGNREGIMWDLVELGRAGTDPSFYFKEFAAPENCAVDDEEAWHVANPALGDFLYLDGLRSNLGTLRESSFRAHRLGQWPQEDNSWLPDHAWAGCANPSKTIPDGADVVISFDGSFSRDLTGIVVATVEERPHIDVVAFWNPEGGTVPIIQVEDTLRGACERWNCLELCADPFRWSRSLEILRGEGLNVVDFPQSPQRMQPATASFYEAVVNNTLTHSGDSELARHIRRAVLKADSRGARLVKPHERLRIDLAVCSVMAFARATFYAAEVGMTGVVLLD